MSTWLQRSQTVLKHWAEFSPTEEEAVFEPMPDGPPGPCVFLPIRDWKDMGKPDKITVTIEPGDRLNHTA